MFGFLIVNSYLASFGIISIGILKARYIGAGAVFLMFVLIAGVVLYPIALFFSRRQSNLKVENIFSSAGSLIFMQYLLFHIAPETAFMNSPGKPSIYVWATLVGIAILILALSRFVVKLSRIRLPSYCIGMGLIIYTTFDKRVLWIFLWLLIMAFIAGYFISELDKVRSKSMPISDMVFVTMIAVSFSLTLCESYAAQLYPKIKNEYGGGKPVSVTLVLSGIEDQELKGLFGDENKTTENLQDVTLIDEDAEYFFILKQTGKETKAMRIKKSLVNAVIHQKK